MKSVLTLSVFAAAAFAQLSAIPTCAQECFSTAVDYAGCVGYDDVLDPTCACTSESLGSSRGGYETGVNYAASLCEEESNCTMSQLGDLYDALNSLCYNTDNSPKYHCGIIPGDPIPSRASITPTGSVTVTLEENAYTTELETLSAYPTGYIATVTSFYVYTTAVVTVQNSRKTEVYTTTDALYMAVCPTTILAGATNITTSHRSHTTSSTSELFDRITAAAASASSEAAIQTTSSTPVTPTGTGAAVTTPKAGSAGKLKIMSLGLFIVMGTMLVFA